MADIWIKMMVSMFDGMSFKKVKRAKIGGESCRDKLTAVWFELLALAGKCNHGGALIGTDGIPFTDLDDIAIQLDRDEDELKLCMAFYLKERMVTIEDDAYTITNWRVYQNVDGMEKIKEQTRKRVADHRARQRLLSIGKSDTCVYCGKNADTIDHIIPRSKNGPDEDWNLVLCCKSCNSSKKDKDLATFLNDSFYYTTQGVDHELVRSNTKLMRFVKYDFLSKRYSNVTVTQCNALEEEGEGDKELEKDIDRENDRAFNHSFQKEIDKLIDLSTGLSTTEDTKRKMLGGELGKGVVFLSNDQMDDLLDKLSIEEFDHYVSVVADCILNGKPFKKKTHYRAILDMAMADRKVK